MDPSLWPTLADAASMLESRGIASAVIGGVAVSLRGQPRMTIDVDLVIQADVEDALRLVRDLDATPFAPLFPGIEEVVSTAFIIPLRHRTTGVRVDFAVGLSGFGIASALGEALDLDVAGRLRAARAAVGA